MLRSVKISNTHKGSLHHPYKSRPSILCK